MSAKKAVTNKDLKKARELACKLIDQDFEKIIKRNDFMESGVFKGAMGNYSGAGKDLAKAYNQDTSCDDDDDKDKGPSENGENLRSESEAQPGGGGGCGWPFSSPLILDLDGDGVETSGYAGYFDHDGNGFAERTKWVGPDDGLLVRDLNGDGRINNGRELFGNHTRLADGSRAANGFAALAELDDNDDGVIDTNDSAWSELRIWRWKAEESDGSDGGEAASGESGDGTTDTSTSEGSAGEGGEDCGCDGESSGASPDSSGQGSSETSGEGSGSESSSTEGEASASESESPLELVTLESLGIASIALAYTESDRVDEHGNGHFPVGRYTTTGGTALRGLVERYGRLNPEGVEIRYRIPFRIDRPNPWGFTAGREAGEQRRKDCEKAVLASAASRCHRRNTRVRRVRAGAP